MGRVGGTWDLGELSQKASPPNRDLRMVPAEAKAKENKIARCERKCQQFPPAAAQSDGLVGLTLTL